MSSQDGYHWQLLDASTPSSHSAAAHISSSRAVTVWDPITARLDGPGQRPVYHYEMAEPFPTRGRRDFDPASPTVPALNCRHI